MDVDNIFPYFIGLIFAAIAITFVVNAIRHGGIKAGIFGAEIERTAGEVQLTRRALGSSTLRVHVLRVRGETKVGLELVNKAVLSYQMMPYTISLEQARALADLLESAATPPSAENIVSRG